MPERTGLFQPEAACQRKHRAWCIKGEFFSTVGVFHPINRFFIPEVLTKSTEKIKMIFGFVYYPVQDDGNRTLRRLQMQRGRE